MNDAWADNAATQRTDAAAIPYFELFMDNSIYRFLS